MKNPFQHYNQAPKISLPINQYTVNKHLKLPLKHYGLVTTYGSWFITGLDNGLSKRRPAFIRTNADVSLLKQLGKRNVSLLTQTGKRNLVTKYNQMNMPCISKYVQVFAYVCNIL